MNIPGLVKRSRRASLVRKMVVGLLGGVVATGPMTMAMLELHRCLGIRDRQPLPPREITNKVLNGVGLGSEMSNTEISTMTLLNHFAYGGVAGVGYTLVAPRASQDAISKGIVGGLILWGISYLGLLPGLNILKPATQHSPSRNLLMVGVHLIWGIVLACFVKVVLRETKRTHGALAGGSVLPHWDAK